MSVIGTFTHPKELWPGIKAIWGQTYNEHPKEYTDLFDIDTSDKNYEEDLQHTGFPLAPVKTEGQSVSYYTDLQGPVSRYTHVVYGSGYIVTREELDDNLYMQVSKRRAAANAFSLAQTEENVAANIYNRAFNTSFVGGDGVTLINTAHPNTSGGTFSNRLATPANLSEAAIEDMLILMMGATNDNGLKISVMPSSLIVSKENFFTANRIMRSVFRTGTANNDVNVVAAIGAFPKGLHMNHYLTSPTAWFIRSNVQNGMKYYLRRAEEFTQDNDFDTENAKAKSTKRFSVGWSDPRGIWGTPGV